jgi:hypothetical protein
MRRRLLTSGIDAWVEKHLTGFKVASGAVFLLSIYTFTYNCVRVDDNPPLHTFWALIQSALGVAFFGAGLWWERRWLKHVHIVLMLLVSFTTLNFNTDPYLGLRFLFVSLVIAVAYDVFDSAPGWKIFAAMVVSFIGILIVYKDPVKSLMTWLNFAIESALLGYILWDKVRRWKTAFEETRSIARDSIALNESQLRKEPPHESGKH